MKKALNIFSIILEVICEIVLLPFHILKAVCSIVDELRK